ncbi:hypothetical protein CUR178_05807 [Leishmania enriettii]|uniref:N-acetyltransferase ESCO acetyl-transferase domain-containing protein n=1 Tax=Leishmania enriettii TaxID=5663 RepID=A0A836GES9_LEIEN|nr:hypothetical protein CUR178_05807 [Leishmania enriettii]
MPARAKPADSDAGARAVSSTWLTLADFKRHVFSPGYVVEDDVGTPTRVTESAERPPTAATAVLYDFFAERLRRKRSRGTASPIGRAGYDGNAGGVRDGLQRSNTIRPSCCSATLRNAVLAVLHAAHDSIGSAEVVCHGRCVVVAHVTATREEVSCSSSPKRGSCAPVWYLDGVCVAEDISQAYRAMRTSRCISCEQQRHLTTDDITAVAAESHTSSPSSIQPTVMEIRPRTQTTYVGESFHASTPLCGVRLMWVSPSSRGRRVAYSMVERARHAVCYGFVVPAEHVAFSEPTAMGSAFARRYQAREDFLVYYY